MSSLAASRTLSAWRRSCRLGIQSYTTFLMSNVTGLRWSRPYLRPEKYERPVSVGIGVMRREGSGHRPMTVLAARSFSHVQRPVTRYWATVQRQSRRGDRDGFGAPGGGPSRSASGDFVLKSPAL